MDIGNKIKQLRLKSGFTQEQLAERLGISSQSISKWETAVTMPDITLLPALAEEFGVTIDELFDLTINQKLQRIENRLDFEEELDLEDFKAYEALLKTQLDENENKAWIYSLLANLYHHRMQADARRVSKYAREAIMLKPEKKDCQWLLQKAEGATVWDWNMGNHTAVIDFYKSVIENDKIEPKTPMPYYEIMDNLLADHRVEEAKRYLDIYQTLPAHKPFLVPVYKAQIALAEYDVKKADVIMTEALKDFADNSGFQFELAQYYARKCEYLKAIECYETSWKLEEGTKSRYTDALHGIAIIYEILKDYPHAIETYDRLIVCLKDEWGYKDEDFSVVEIERQKMRLQKNIQ